MSKVLRIAYAGIVMHDGPVDEFQLSENSDGIAVIGKVKPAVKPATSGVGLLEALAAARKSQTAGMAERKRRELDTTTASDASTIDIAETEPEGNTSD